MTTGRINQVSAFPWSQAGVCVLWGSALAHAATHKTRTAPQATRTRSRVETVKDGSGQAFSAKRIPKWHPERSRPLGASHCLEAPLNPLPTLFVQATQKRWMRLTRGDCPPLSRRVACSPRHKRLSLHAFRKQGLGASPPPAVSIEPR